MICSNLAAYPVARAVAASNGFPVLFTPITLTSHRKECRATTPRVAEMGYDSLAFRTDQEEDFSRRANLGRIMQTYLDSDQTQYVHLMDGGIADNLALRALFDRLTSLRQEKYKLERISHVTRRVLIISVDGQAAADPTLGQKHTIGGLGTIFSAVSGTQIDAYNFETLLLADQTVKGLVKQIRGERCAEGRIVAGHPCDDVRGKLVHLSLDDVADPTVRRQLQAIPTGLTITRQDVDLLLKWGERLVRENADIRSLIEGLDTRPQAALVRSRSGG
jgi:NTE family protein